MSGTATVVLAGVAIYAAAGIATGLAFVLCGVSRVLGEPMPVTAAHLAACRMRSEAAITGPLYVCLCPTASPISPNPPV